MQGYIKLHRSIMEWEWYKDIPVRILFEHCLLRANHKLKKWQGQVIEAGSFITSYENLSIETGLTVQQIRTAINKLKSTGEITYKSTSRNSIISINNWNEYQEDNTQINKQITNNQQTINKQSTTNNNDKNDKNDKNKEEVEEEKKKIASDFYGEYSNVYLSPKNYDKIKTFVLNDATLTELINELSETIASKSDRYKPYDDKFPDAHFTYLKKFWEFRKNNPAKFMTKADTGGTVNIKSIIDKTIAEGKKKYGLK